MPHVIIVGAGITGLSAAHVLADAGWQVHIIDKEPQPGGRFTTLHFGDSARTIDNGAQFLTTRDQRFANAVAAWEKNGWVKQWCHGIPLLTASGINYEQDGFPRFIGSNGMHQLASTLALGFDIQLRATAKHLTITDKLWDVAWESEENNTDKTNVTRADAIILTQPAPSLIPLLSSSQISVPNEIRSIRYAPCFSLAVDFSEQITPLLPPPGAVRVDDPASPLMWAATAHGRGLSRNGDALVLHASEIWTTTHLTQSMENKSKLLIKDSQETLMRLGISADILSLSSIARQWINSRCVAPIAQPYVRLQTPAPLFIAGDGFGNCPRVEGAWVSGYMAATTLRDEWST